MEPILQSRLQQEYLFRLLRGRAISVPRIVTPYWRTLKANGELNAKYPGGIEAQKEKLEAEGHTIVQKGRKNIRYYVKDYERALFVL